MANSAQKIETSQPRGIEQFHKDSRADPLNLMPGLLCRHLLRKRPYKSGFLFIALHNLPHTDASSLQSPQPSYMWSWKS